jgi:hypothetical protein
MPSFIYLFLVKQELKQKEKVTKRKRRKQKNQREGNEIFKRRKMKEKN